MQLIDIEISLNSKVSKKPGRKSQSSDHDTIAWKLLLYFSAPKTKQRNVLWQQMLPPFDMNWNRMIMIAMMDCAILQFSFSLWLWQFCFRAFLLVRKCAANSPRPEKWLNWQWKLKTTEHHIASCFDAFEKLYFFFFVVKYKNVSKRCFQSRPFEPNNKKAHSFSRKSQAADAKSKWAKIETGFGFGYRWEMFVSRCCGGAEQTGPEEKKKFAIGRVFLAHWVSWLHQTGPLRRGQFMSFWSAIVIPISCVSIAPSHFSLNQHHRICFMWAPSYDHKLCIKTSQNGFGLDPAFCTSKPRKKTFFFPLNFHRSINKGMVEEHIKKHIISFMCCL